MRILVLLGVVCLVAGCFESEPTIRIKDEPRPVLKPLPAATDEGEAAWFRIGAWELPAQLLDAPLALKVELVLEGQDRCRVALGGADGSNLRRDSDARVWQDRNGTLRGYAATPRGFFVRPGPVDQGSSTITTGRLSMSIHNRTEWTAFVVDFESAPPAGVRLTFDCNHLPLTMPRWYGARQVLYLTDRSASGGATVGLVDAGATVRGEADGRLEGAVETYFASNVDWGELRIQHPRGTEAWSLHRNGQVRPFVGAPGHYHVEFSHASVDVAMNFHDFWSVTFGWQSIPDPGALAGLPT